MKPQDPEKARFETSKIIVLLGKNNLFGINHVCFEILASRNVRGSIWERFWEGFGDLLEASKSWIQKKEASSKHMIIVAG